MYARFWCRVNVMSTEADTLLPLCQLFEEIVQAHRPSLFMHLLTIGVNPLQLALPWIQFGCATYLDVDQVLLLWDRVLGFDTLEVLSVFAASVFVYREADLMECATLEEARDVLADGSSLKVVPLLQWILFPPVEGNLY